ncbi:MAG: hypothetical protein R3A10_15605 [Caldilineaceae bacterium]
MGGRVWTNCCWPGAPVDMGASWIHGVRGNPLRWRTGNVRLAHRLRQRGAVRHRQLEMSGTLWERIDAKERARWARPEAYASP